MAEGEVKDDDDVSFHSDSNEDEDDGFDVAAFSVENTEYGILNLLICRSVMLENETEKPSEMANLKVVETRLCNFPAAPSTSKRSRANKEHSTREHREAPAPSDDSGDSASDGEHGDQTRPASWSGKPGSWWRVHNQLGEELLVRDGVSIKSLEVRRVPPGELVQQGGLARSLVSGPAKGCIRLPVRPSGWVTADATRAGGPKYLVRASVPRWRVVHCPADGKGGKGGKEGCVIVREEESLKSEEVLTLQKGDVVEQAGPVAVLDDGIIRMPVTATVIRRSDVENGEYPERAPASGKAIGWVTVDASAAGGPTFFKPVAEADRDDKQQPRRRLRKPAA